MNYNYVLSTGSSVLSESFYSIDEKNIPSSVGEYHYVDFSVISGRLISNVSLNSQTLLENSPSIYTGTNIIHYEILSGDYFFDTERLANFGKVFLDTGLIVRNNNIMLCDKRPLYTGVLEVKSGSSILTGVLYEITNQLITRGELNGGASFNVDLFTGWDVYFNGQKLPSYEEATGLSSSATGRCFAIKKQDKIFEFNSGSPDCFGQNFIAMNVDYYINGMEQQANTFLETYTGVNMITAGVPASVALFNQETNSYNL